MPPTAVGSQAYQEAIVSTAENSIFLGWMVTGGAPLKTTAPPPGTGIYITQIPRFTDFQVLKDTASQSDC